MKTVAAKTDVLYVIEADIYVDDGPRQTKLIGPWYRDKAAAKSWVPFVRNVYYGAPTRVRTFTRAEAKAIQANGGQEKARTV